MSLRKRLIVSIALLLSVLWLAALGWFLIDVRAELRQVLDARLASSARMVQGLLAQGDLQLDPGRLSSRAPGELEPLPFLPTQLACQLWTLDGDVVAFSDGTQPLPREPEEDGFSMQLVDGQMWRVFTLTDADNGIRIATAERQSLRTVLVRDVALAVSGPFLLALPGMGLLIWFGVGRGLAPLERVRASVQSRHADALEPIEVQRAPVEVAPLLDALNALFKRLGATIERERRFTGNAAHELRTPLTGVKTQVQIARSAEGEIQAHALAQAENGLDRMSRLVRQLLTLARLDSTEEALQEQQVCSARSEIDEVLQEMAEPAARLGVFLVSDEVPDLLRVAMPAGMLQTALRNLAENAINHSPPGGNVLLTAEVAATRIRLFVSDSGPGLSRPQLAAVMQPFYRAEGGIGDGSGLGLSIVLAICERYGGRLHLANNAAGPGLIASLDLPLG